MAELTVQPMTNIDDPDNRVQFLEETLPDKDWRTTIIYPDSSTASLAHLKQTQATLEARGYIATIGSNEKSQLALQLHHLGRDTTITTIMQEMGFERGVHYWSHHPGALIGKTFDAAKKQGKELAADPARLNGFIFTSAEVFLTAAGMLGNSTMKIPEKWMPIRRRANLLQSVAGSLFLGQSLIYLLLARSNDELAMDQIHRKVDYQLKHGGDVEKIGFNAATDHADRKPIGLISSFIRKYPIQIGALFNVTGMFVYIGHVFTQKKLQAHVATLPIDDANISDFIKMETKRLQSVVGKITHFLDKDKNLSGHEKAVKNALEHIADAKTYTEKNWKYGVAGCMASIVAWGIMLLPHREKKRAEEKPRGVLGLLKDNPQAITSAMAFSSSSLRLVESFKKRNWLQMTGEAIYVPGDLMLMLIHNDEYGDSDKNNDKLAKKLTAYIQQIPMVLGPEKQKELVESIGKYLEQKALADLQDHATDKKLTPEQIAERAQRTVALARNHLQRSGETPFDKLAEASLRLINNFPDEMRAPLRDKLVDGLSRMPWVHATTQELQGALENHVPLPASESLHADEVTRNIHKDMAAIAAIVPGTDMAASITALHAIVAPFTQRANRPLSRPDSNISLADMALEAPLQLQPAR